MNFGEYSVKKVKTFRGSDFDGYNAELYRGKMKVADILDEGNGGEVMIDWDDRTASKVRITAKGHDGKPREYDGTPEQKILIDFIATLPPEIYDEYTLDVSDDMFVGALVDAFEEDKKLRRMCKKKTVVKTTDCKDCEFVVISRPYDPKYKDLIMKKYGTTFIEIVNEKFQ
jgi:hypothetical protein